MSVPPAAPLEPGASLRPLWGLDAAIRLLNHGAYGATPKEVMAEQRRWQERLEADPPRFFTQRLPDLIREAAARLAAFLGTAAERLAFVENATSGINAVIFSVGFASSDEILTTDHVYPGIRNALRHAAARSRARLIEAALPHPVADDEAVIESLRGHLTANTRLVVIDHIASGSATRFPVAAIALLCRERGVPLIVDGAHAPGMAELDIDAIGADWYAGNCHKWLCAPKGAGFLVKGAHAKQEVHPVVISNSYEAGFPAEFDYVGTRDPSAWLSVPAALDFHERLGGAELRRRNRSLARQAAELVLGEIEGELAAQPPLFEAMVAIRLAGLREGTRADARRVQTALSREHDIEAGITLIADRMHLRLSAFAHNELDEYRGVGDALAAVLMREGLRSS
jgi:isopenicillin-N epimerase